MSTLIPFISFALAPDPSLAESLKFQMTGLVVVFFALGSIWGLTELIGYFFQHRESQAPAPAAVVAAAPTPADDCGSPGPELTAVIAAAVHMVLGPGHRIQAIAPVPESMDWAREGRRHIFASHKTR